MSRGEAYGTRGPDSTGRSTACPHCNAARDYHLDRHWHCGGAGRLQAVDSTQAETKQGAAQTSLLRKEKILKQWLISQLILGQNTPKTNNQEEMCIHPAKHPVYLLSTEEQETRDERNKRVIPLVCLRANVRMRVNT